METNEILAVHIDEEGIVHKDADTGKLIVGDLDIVRMALDAWGGNRQRGRVELKIYVRSKGSVNTSPDMSGVYAEVSEPAQVGGLG